MTKSTTPVVTQFASTVYNQNGLDFTPTRPDALNLHSNLPPGNYLIKVNPMTEQLYFSRCDDFPMPSKIYGNTLTQADRILRTFQDRPFTTGVLLEGEKGSGKSLLAKVLAISVAQSLGLPIILINAPWCGDRFNQLISNLGPAMLLFDEFEKTYEDKDAQKQVLTLLDGVFPSKKLMVFTVNDKHKLDSHLTNRPGRIFYSLNYSGLTEEFVREYCEDNLTNKAHIEDVIGLRLMFRKFNFDMLKALVEDMNRYNESPRQALEYLNIDPSTETLRFDISVELEGVKFTCVSELSYRGLPSEVKNFRNNVYAGQSLIKKLPGESEVAHSERAEAFFKKYGLEVNEYHYFTLNPSDMISADVREGEYIFKDKNGLRVMFRRERDYGSACAYSWMA